MVGEEEDGLNSDDLNVEDNIEIEATKVEIGAKYEVVSNELENGEAFIVVFLQQTIT
jgi:hypothetical protein